MLNTLTLINFRGFKKHSIPFHNLTLIVGKNNAGKSTIVEALRLLSIVTERYQHLPVVNAPGWTGLPMRTRGVRAAVGGLGIDFKSICFGYNDPPAQVRARFNGGVSVDLSISPDEEMFAIAEAEESRTTHSRRRARSADLPVVRIMPHIGPLLKTEYIHTEETIKRGVSTHLGSHHFRNQLRIYPQYYETFRRVVEETWAGVQVYSIEAGRGIPGDPITLEIRNQEFVGEVGLMGHGLQMWLQTIWFIVRAQEAETIILDEPDVYMHADLQRKLIRFLKRRNQQLVLTSHSIEMMSEVDTDDILVVNRRKSKSAFASSESSVQKLITAIGSIHNIQATRLMDARRLILVEGDDFYLLNLFHDTIFPEKDSLGVLPHADIGGWSNWSLATGSAFGLKNTVGEDILVYCILDRDYHTNEEIISRYEDANRRGVRLHIWKKKEIENYLLVPETICRIIQASIGRSKAPPSIDSVERKIIEYSMQLEIDCFDALSNDYYLLNRSRGLANANREARTIISAAKRNLRGMSNIVSGKALLSKLSGWSQQEFDVGLGAGAIARNMRLEEIDTEIRATIRAINQGEPLPHLTRPALAES